jgi:cation diffusion facilitator family transporter
VVSQSTRRTVLVAGTANLVIAASKLAAGLAVGSSAMLSESAHSLADTINQAFLLASLRRAQRPADSEHPFGYGQERYFWSLLAAVSIFVAGAGFSVFEGVLTITRDPRTDSGTAVAFIVLGVAVVAEGTSLARAGYQMGREARERRRELLEHVRRSPDTTVKAALFEDTAALAGLALAAAGLILRSLTGSPVWDGSASIAIGLLLVVVAYRLGRDSKDGLIGHAIDPDEQRLIADEISSTAGIDAIVALRTMHLGPENVIIAAEVAFSDGISADHAEDIAGAIDQRLRRGLTVTPHVYLDPTQTSR